MMKTKLAGRIVLTGLFLFATSPARADLKALNKCSATLSKAVRKLVNAKVKLLNKCADTVVTCNEGADPDTCIAGKAMATGKPCSMSVLDPSNPVTKLGNAIQSFKDGVDKKCTPSDSGRSSDEPDIRRAERHHDRCGAERELCHWRSARLADRLQ